MRCARGDSFLSPNSARALRHTSLNTSAPVTVTGLHRNVVIIAARFIVRVFLRFSILGSSPPKSSSFSFVFVFCFVGGRAAAAARSATSFCAAPSANNATIAHCTFVVVLMGFFPFLFGSSLMLPEANPEMALAAVAWPSIFATRVSRRFLSAFFSRRFFFRRRRGDDVNDDDDDDDSTIIRLLRLVFVFVATSSKSFSPSSSSSNHHHHHHRRHSSSSTHNSRHHVVCRRRHRLLLLLLLLLLLS